MTFNEIMALILPSFIALLFYLKISNSKMNLIEGICNLAFFMLVTNLLCYAIISLLKIDPVRFTTLFTMKYTLMSTIIGLVLALIYRFIELNIKIKVKVESVDEKENV